MSPLVLYERFLLPKEFAHWFDTFIDKEAALTETGKRCDFSDAGEDNSV
jgi:hypothetical protein